MGRLLMHGRGLMLLLRRKLMRMGRRWRGCLVHPHLVHPATQTRHHALRPVEQFLQLSLLAVQIRKVSFKIDERRNGGRTAGRGLGTRVEVIARVRVGRHRKGEMIRRRRRSVYAGPCKWRVRPTWRMSWETCRSGASERRASRGCECSIKGRQIVTSMRIVWERHLAGYVMHT